MNKPFALIGAELDGHDVYSNYRRTNELRSELVKLGLSFVGVTNISSAKKSQLFIVTGSNESAIVSLARKYGQKAILSSDGSNTEVVSTKSNGRTELGKFVAVSSRDIAAKSRFYITFVEDGREHFYVTKKGASCD